LKKIIENQLSTLDGVITASYDVKSHIITCHYRVKEIALRVLLENSKKISGLEVTHIPEKGNNGDIRDILAAEVRKYKNRFVTSFIMLLPILVFMWAIPYTNPEFLTGN